MSEVEFSWENTLIFFLTATKAHGEHLAIVDAAPFIKSRLQYAVSFSLPRMAEHKQQQNLLLGQPQKSKGKNLHRVPGNLIQPGWKSTEEGGQCPSSSILSLRFECSIVALEISWSELITKEAKENKKIMTPAKLSQDAADSVTYLQTCLAPRMHSVRAKNSKHFSRVKGLCWQVMVKTSGWDKAAQWGQAVGLLSRKAFRQVEGANKPFS